MQSQREKMRYISPKCKEKKHSNPHPAGLFPKADSDRNEVKTYSQNMDALKTVRSHSLLLLLQQF